MPVISVRQANSNGYVACGLVKIVFQMFSLLEVKKMKKISHFTKVFKKATVSKIQFEI